MILATAGHIDHGKTALVRALTGVDADRLPEEKRRGLTIDLGFAYTTLPDGTELGFVDVPGHERFLANMLAGILSIDQVLLIVAADDGPRPQTLEHLDILELIGVARVTGVITKIDRVPDERRVAVAAEVAALLADAGFSDSPIYPISSITGDGIPALTQHLSDAARAASAMRAARPAAGRFRMPLDRAFSLPGIGLVITGTAASGHVTVGDHVCLSPRGIELRVRGIHAQNHPAERARAGDRCALNLAGSVPDGAEPRRGDWIVDPVLHRPVSRVDLGITVSRAAPAPLRSGLPVHFHLGTEDAVGRLAVLGARAIEPGETGFVQVDFEQSIAALWGDRAIIRDHAARLTLAGGRVLDPVPPRRGRARPERLAMLAALAEPDAGDALERLLEAAGIAALAPFALSRNLPLAEVEALVEAGGFCRFGAGATGIALSPGFLAALGDTITAALAEWHRAQPDALGPARNALFGRMRGAAPAAAFDAALAELIEAKRVVRTGAILRLPEHQPRLSAEDEKLWGRVRPLLAKGGVRPPRVRELAGALGLEPEPLTRFLKRAERFGRVAPVAANRFFLPETIVRLTEIAATLSDETPERQFTAAGFKDRSGIGRNLTIEVLEYLDAVGITRRVGDARVVVRSATEVFG
ncbi:MAG TPA: selenocysteine-specific translation elongation factor [Stellaceae bacterium]|jgi:selenocysteine-specific elongation factor|nr:selenocysteine-specific translation elongation factor [Stellaceae bacterium]